MLELPPPQPREMLLRVLKVVVGLFLASIAMFLIGMGVMDVVRNVEPDQCEMTWMYQWPQYVPIILPDRIVDEFPKYGLYYYVEEGNKAKDMEPTRALHLTGIPVLFLPGNAGSHKQARSMATVALRMYSPRTHANHFDYFTLGFNEELSGVYGRFLRTQIQFARFCIEHVLTSMYASAPSPPSSIILLAHSVGGVAATSLLEKNVQLVITLGSPHLQPVASIDEDLADTTSSARMTTQSSNVTVVSIGGGPRDYMVHSSLTKSSQGGSFSLLTSAVPRVWISVDHEALVWCRQLILSLNRALFKMIDPETRQMTSDSSLITSVLERYLFDHPFAEHPPKKSAEVHVRPNWRLLGGWNQSKKYVFSLADAGQENDTFIAVTNTPLAGWIAACNSSNCSHPHPLESFLLPARYAETKLAVVDLNALRESRSNYSATHIGLWIGASRITKLQNAVFAGGHFIMRKSLRYRVKLSLGIKPSRTVIIPRGSPYAVIDVEGFHWLYQAYNVSADEKDCRSPKVLYVFLHQHVPWYKEDHFSPLGERSTSFLLQLQTPPPPSPSFLQSSNPGLIELRVFKDPDCDVKVEFKVHFTAMLGQVVQFYRSFLCAMILFSLLVKMAFLESSCSKWFGVTVSLALALWSVNGLVPLLVDTDWSSDSEAGAALLNLPFFLLVGLVTTSWLVSMLLDWISQLILFIGRKIVCANVWMLALCRLAIVGCGVVSIHELGYLIGCVAFFIKACASSESVTNSSVIVASSWWLAVVKIPAVFVKLKDRLWSLPRTAPTEVNVHVVALIVAALALTFLSVRKQAGTVKRKSEGLAAVLGAAVVFLYCANSLYRAGLVLSLLFLYLV